MGAQAATAGALRLASPYALNCVIGASPVTTKSQHQSVAAHDVVGSPLVHRHALIAELPQSLQERQVASFEGTRRDLQLRASFTASGPRHSIAANRH
jgi:hypothetical protein